MDNIVHIHLSYLKYRHDDPNIMMINYIAGFKFDSCYFQPISTLINKSVNQGLKKHRC